MGYHEFSDDSGEFLLKREVYRVVGCAMEVLNELGHGLLPYSTLTPSRRLVNQSSHATQQ